MRVITGTARGKKLRTLDGVDVRPTSDMVKEAMFSAIQFELEDKAVLDLFSGSGQLGIEALSRGADSCVFVEKNPDAVQVIRKNLTDCRVQDRARIVPTDCFTYVRTCTEKFGLILLDPPYRQELALRILPELSPVLQIGTLVFCEHEREIELPDMCGRLHLRKRYRYGKTALTSYLAE